MNILTNFVTSVNCKTDLGVFLDTIPFLGDAASSHISNYSPNSTLKNCWAGLPDGVTSIVAFTALFLSFTSTPLVIG